MRKRAEWIPAGGMGAPMGLGKKLQNLSPLRFSRQPWWGGGWLLSFLVHGTALVLTLVSASQVDFGGGSPSDSEAGVHGSGMISFSPTLRFEEGPRLLSEGVSEAPPAEDLGAASAEPPSDPKKPSPVDGLSTGSRDTGSKETAGETRKTGPSSPAGTESERPSAAEAAPRSPKGDGPEFVLGAPAPKSPALLSPWARSRASRGLVPLHPPDSERGGIRERWDALAHGALERKAGTFSWVVRKPLLGSRALATKSRTAGAALVGRATPAFASTAVPGWLPLRPVGSSAGSRLWGGGSSANFRLGPAILRPPALRGDLPRVQVEPSASSGIGFRPVLSGLDGSRMNGSRGQAGCVSINGSQFPVRH
jgi:hypothetical protein